MTDWGTGLYDALLGGLHRAGRLDMDLLEIPCAGDRVVGADGGDAMRDLYWRLFSAWHALLEAPTRAETIEHCALEAHKRQEEINMAFASGYLNGYDDAAESMRQREMV